MSAASGERGCTRRSADRRRLEGTDGDVGHDRTDAAAARWCHPLRAAPRATGTLTTGRRVCRRRKPSACVGMCGSAVLSRSDPMQVRVPRKTSAINLACGYNTRRRRRTIAVITQFKPAVIIGKQSAPRRRGDTRVQNTLFECRHIRDPHRRRDRGNGIAVYYDNIAVTGIVGDDGFPIV